MPKATIEYDLGDFDDVMAHKRAVKATDLASAIFDIVYNTKKYVERQIEDEKYDKYDALDLVFERIQGTLEEFDINIDELIL